MNKIFISLLLLMAAHGFLHAQCLTLGADLSYVNTIEANGGIYHNENGTAVDPFAYFAERGANMARVRLWHTPENNTDVCGNPITANNFQDVASAFQRAKSAGMQLNLAVHYGDYFNDPAKQKMPAAWAGLSHAVLIDSIYRYTYSVLEKLFTKNILPDIIAIGNETTWGFIDPTDQTDGWEWPQDAEKFNTGLNAVDQFNTDHNTSIKKAIHFTDKTAGWLAGLFQENGISNYDIIGLSFYPKWTEFKSVPAFGELTAQLIAAHNKEVMVFETGAVWTSGSVDNHNNIMNDFGDLIYPISPQGQKDFLFDLANTVFENGGTGILYWEPAWVTSNMCDKWGQGSSYENVCFFDFNDDNAPLPAFDFFDYCNMVNSTSEENDFEINVFPNPNNGRDIYIKSSTAISSWQLINPNGQVLKEGIFLQQDSLYKIQIGQPIQGLYFLNVKTVAGKLIRKQINFNK